MNVAGERFLANWRDLGSAGGASGADQLVEGAKKAGQELGDTSESTIKLSTALKALKPALAEAGFGLGELGAIARLANTSLVAFGVATAAAIAVGLGKLEENAIRTRGVLQDAFKTTGAGDQAFAALTASAQQFGTTVGGLAPGLIAFQTALANVDRTAKGFVALRAEDLPFGLAPPTLNAVTTAYDNFIKLLRAGRLTQDEAEKSATNFFNAMKEGGVATKAALQALPIGTIDLLKQALGVAGISNAQFFAAIDAGALSIDKLQQALAGFGAQAEKAFDAKAVKTMGEEVSRVLAELGKGFGELTGKPFSDFVIGELERIRKGIRDTKDELLDVIELVRREEEKTGSDLLGKIVQKVRTFFTPETIPLPRPRPAEADETPRILFKTDALDKNTRALMENLAAIRANIAAEREAVASKAASIQQTIDQGGDIEKGIEQLNAFHDALIDLRRKQDEQEKAARAAADKRLDEDAAAESLKNIFKTVPAEAEASGAASALAFGKGWVSAPIKEEISASIQDSTRDLIKTGLTVPAEAQAELTAKFKQTGIDSGINFSEGLQQTPPDFSKWLQALTDFGNAAVSQAQQIYQQIQAAFANPIQITGQFTGPLGTFTGGGSGEFLAGGGRVRGPGTATSDSILAFLSRGEFVVNARSTELFLPLLHAINAGRLPPDFIGRFSMGGLVRALSANKFAAGGQIQTSGSSHTFVLPSGQTFEATLTDQTVARLKRYSVKSRMASTGRKPGWVT
jgi:hypothetical protein